MAFYITSETEEVVDCDNPTKEDEKRWIEYLREYGPILPKEYKEDNDKE